MSYKAASSRRHLEQIIRAKTVQKHIDCKRHRCDTQLCCHAPRAASFVHNCRLVLQIGCRHIFHVLSAESVTRRSTMKLALIALLLPSALAAVKKTAANAKETAFLEVRQGEGNPSHGLGPHVPRPRTARRLPRISDALLARARRPRPSDRASPTPSPRPAARTGATTRAARRRTTRRARPSTRATRAASRRPSRRGKSSPPGRRPCRR